MHSRARWAILLVVVLAVAGAVSWIAVGSGSGGGGSARPDRPTITVDAAIHAVISYPAPDDLDAETAHAELHAFGELAGDHGELASTRPRHVDDYPVWVVTISGWFGTRSRSRLPCLLPDLKSATYYIDGYTGTFISRVISGKPPRPAPTPTSIPKRNASVIDDAAATQAVKAYSGASIRPGTLNARLATFAVVRDTITPGLCLRRYADDYPVWVVSASAADGDRIGRSEPTTDTFYLDAYTGHVWVENRAVTGIPAP